MIAEEVARGAFVSQEVSAAFSEAVPPLRDGGQLCFRPGGRTLGEGRRRPEAGGETTFADQVLSLIGLFRLNAKHREVQFQGGSCREVRFGGWKQVR